MSRIKYFYEGHEDKVQQTAHKVIKANGYVRNLEQAYACIKYNNNNLETIEHFSYLLDKGYKKLQNLMQRLIDCSPWWAKFYVDDALTIKVRMTDGELIYFKTRYNYHHQLTDIEIRRFMD